MINIRKRKSWEERYNEIVLFKRFYRLLPGRNPNSPNQLQNSLARWLEIQRSKKKLRKLDIKKIELLDSIGIVWDRKIVDEHKWRKSYLRLIMFRIKNPDRWPSTKAKSKNERALGYWCSYNRSWKQGNLKRYNEYPKEREEKLNLIGFEWIPDDFNKRWEERYEELKNYRVKHPKRWPPKSNIGLFNWVNNQRIGYRLGLLSQQRIKLLNEIDFEWNPNKKHSSYQKN